MPQNAGNSQIKSQTKMKLLLTLLSSLFLGAASLPAADTKPTGVPATYPLKKCPVSDEALGEMGKPIKVTHDGTDVYLCCKSCVKDFDKEPAKYAEMVKKAGKK
jgi:YHS domain-containing protein